MAAQYVDDRRPHRGIRKLFAGLLFALCFFGGADARDDWGMSAQSPPAEVEQVLDMLAALPTLQGHDLDAVLHSMHFKSDISPEHWKTLSESEKLALAYHWAVAVSEENGKAFLFAVARQFGERYEALAFDPVFKATFWASGPPPAVSHIGFRRPPASAMATELPGEVRNMLDALSIYVEGPGPLGRATMARHYFELKPPKLGEALAERDAKAFLAAAAGFAPLPPPLQERLNLIMKDVLRYSEAAGHDPRIEAVAARLQKKFGKPPPDAMPVARAGFGAFDTTPPQEGGGGGGGGGGGSPERMNRAADWHTRFDASMFRNSSASARSFTQIRGRAGGPGGVIAGAPVSATIGKPVTIAAEFTATTPCGGAGQQPKGQIHVRTTRGDFFYSNVSCDVLSAARRITFGGVPGIRPWVSGEAIRLASIDTADLAPVFPLYIPEDGNLDRMGRRWRMLLHPALVDLDIGRAVALLDLWPSARARIAEMTDEDRRVLHWLKTFEDKVTWKWSDVPTVISAKGKEIVVTPTGRHTILSIRLFTEDDLQLDALSSEEGFRELQSDMAQCKDAVGHEEECRKVNRYAKELIGPDGKPKQLITGNESRLLDPASKTLAMRIPDFTRVEELLRALAVFRWAKKEGASLSGSDISLKQPRPATPDTIIVGILDDFIVGAPEPEAHSLHEECARSLEALKKSTHRPDAGDPIVTRRHAMILSSVLPTWSGICGRFVQRVR
jgi:hypothetical protein